MKKHIGLYLLLLVSSLACRSQQTTSPPHQHNAGQGGAASDAASETKTTTTQANEEEAKGAISYYTCPMHRQIHQDKPGNCPICSMTLVPVYKEAPKEFDATNKPASVSISPSSQNTAGIATYEVKEKEAVKSIRASARVAFDPDLAVAIREYQEIAKTAPSLKETAITRLKHLGLSDDEIKKLSLHEDLSSHYHLQSSVGPLWIYATLFENDAAYIKGGENVEIQIAGNENQIVHGVLKSLSPMVDASTRTIRARIEVSSQDERKSLRPDSFVTAKIKIPLGQQITIPKSALIDTGERQLVYIKQGESHFQAQEVSLGGELGDEWIIKEGLKVGDLIVTNATFLVDSETRLQGN